MPTREDRRLKLVKGSAAAASPGRPVRRREVTRRTPHAEDPVTAILERLVDEPVADDSEPVGAAGGPVEARDEPVRAGAAGAAPVGSAAAGTVPTVEGAAPQGGSAIGEEADGVARPSPPRHGSSGRRIAVGVLVAVLCAALTATGIFGYRWYQDRALGDAHQQALAAAKQTTVNFVSVSASSVDRDLQRIADGATGEFQDQFTRGQSQVRAAIVENKVESRGSVLRAGLVSGDRRTAVVLVAVDATVKNVHAPDGRPSHYRIQVDVIRDTESGKWLVSRLQFVG